MESLLRPESLNPRVPWFEYEQEYGQRFNYAVWTEFASAEERSIWLSENMTGHYCVMTMWRKAYLFLQDESDFALCRLMWPETL